MLDGSGRTRLQLPDWPLLIDPIRSLFREKVLPPPTRGPRHFQLFIRRSIVVSQRFIVIFFLGR